VNDGIAVGADGVGIRQVVVVDVAICRNAIHQHLHNGRRQPAAAAPPMVPQNALELGE